MRREVAWFLDEQGRAVMALVWTLRDGRMRVRVRPFPAQLSMSLPRMPTRTVDEVLSHVPIGSDLPCVGGASIESARLVSLPAGQ